MTTIAINASGLHPCLLSGESASTALASLDDEWPMTQARRGKRRYLNWRTIKFRLTYLSRVLSISSFWTATQIALSSLRSWEKVVLVVFTRSSTYWTNNSTLSNVSKFIWARWPTSDNTKCFERSRPWPRSITWMSWGTRLAGSITWRRKSISENKPRWWRSMVWAPGGERRDQSNRPDRALECRTRRASSKRANVRRTAMTLLTGIRMPF